MAMVFASASAVVAVGADDADVDTAHAARPGLATSLPICAQRSCGPPRARRSSGSHIRRWHRRRHHSPDYRSAQPAGECGWSTQVCGCGWSYCRMNSCLASPDGPACAIASAAAIRMKISLQRDRKGFDVIHVNISKIR